MFTYIFQNDIKRVHRRPLLDHLLPLGVVILCLGAFGCDDETTDNPVGGDVPSGGALIGGQAGGATQGGVMSGGVMSGGDEGGAGATMGGVDGGEQGGDEPVWMQGGEGGEMSGGTPLMIPDECLNTPPIPDQLELDLTPRCQTQGEPLKVRHIRDPSCSETFVRAPEGQPGVEIQLEGLVVSGIFDDKFSVQDAEGGAFSGLWVYNSNRAEFPDLRVGSRVTLSGQLIEFYTVTELVVRSEGVIVTDQGPAPEPFVVSDPSLIADGGAWVEPLESMLLNIPVSVVTLTAPDCPQDFGMFVIDESLRIAQDIELEYVASRGDLLTDLNGVLHYSFDHQKLLPRGDGDFVITFCGGVPDKCEASECVVLPDARESGRVIVTEIQNNPSGEDELREYVELYNPSSSAIELAGWTLQDCGARTAQLTGQIEARGYFVVARNRDRDLNGGVGAQAEMGDLFLPNGYGSVILFDAEGTLVDQVRYAASGEGWPDRAPGASLELIEPASDNNDGASWTAGEDRYGEGGRGTPGAAYR